MVLLDQIVIRTYGKTTGPEIICHMELNLKGQWYTVWPTVFRRDFHSKSRKPDIGVLILIVSQSLGHKFKGK